MLQADPSQCSVSVLVVPPSTTSPTAQTSVKESVLTPNKTPLAPGLGITRQRVPSQCSIKVPEEVAPTAQTSVEERNATPERPLSSVSRLGLGMTRHCVPFQCSMST